MTASKNTPEVKAAIVESVRNGAYAKHAAAEAGVDESTMYRWLDADGEFAQAVAQAKAARTNRGIRVIARAAEDGDWRAEAWLLERTQPEDFRELKSTEHSGSIGLEGVLLEDLGSAAE